MSEEKLELMPEEPSAEPKSKRGCLIALFVVVGLGVALIVGLVAFGLSKMDSLLGDAIRTVGPQVLQAPVKLDEVSLSPFSGRGEVRGLEIGNPQGFKSDYAFRLGTIAIALNSIGEDGNVIHIEEIRIEDPSIIYEGLPGQSNMDALRKNINAHFNLNSDDTSSARPETAAQKTGQQEPKVIIDDFLFSGATVSYSMELLSKNYSYTLPALRLQDIGKENSTTIVQAVDQIVEAIHVAIEQAVKDGGLPLKGGDKKAIEKTLKEEAKRQGVKALERFLSK